MVVKKIIACADIHIMNYKRQEECLKQMNKFIEKCKEIASNYEKDEVRIVVAGDIVHNKLDISGEGYTIAAYFLRKLGEIAKTYIIAGNHDINFENISRTDPLSAIFAMCEYDNVVYLDKELGYESGCFIDDNICWCLYSIFSKFAAPDILEKKLSYDGLTYVGLYHGDIKGCKTDVGYAPENGLEASFFEGIDFGIAGHIHKRQCVKHNGVPIVYCGSLIQQNHGENVHGHGFVIWDVEDCNWEEIDIPNEEYGFLTFTINDESDIDNDLENVINL